MVSNHDKKRPQPLTAPILLGSAYAGCQTIHDTIDTFWGLSLPVRILSVSSNPHYYWYTQDFYVAQKGLDKHGQYWAQLRISEGTCQYLFETTLGKSPLESRFHLGHVRSFEVFLLERFSRKLFYALTPLFLKRSASPASLASETEELCHLVWALKGGTDQVNQLILTVPKRFLKLPRTDLQATQTVWHLPDRCFLEARLLVHMRLGRTRARLEELKQLDVGDVVIFEHSSSEIWEVWDPLINRYRPIPVKLPPDLSPLDLPKTQGSHAMVEEMTLKQTLWDNLEVEVTACFRPIRLPLKRVKEMEQGLVIELTDLVENKLQIEVEGNPVAWGELLILDDKFAVRIQGLHEEVQPFAQNPLVPVSTPVASASVNIPVEPAAESTDMPVPPVVPSAAETDFDLDESDFDDLDDEEDWT